MILSRVKISCFCAKAHLVFHWCSYNKKEIQLSTHRAIFHDPEERKTAYVCCKKVCDSIFHYWIMEIVEFGGPADSIKRLANGSTEIRKTQLTSSIEDPGEVSTSKLIFQVGFFVLPVVCDCKNASHWHSTFIDDLNCIKKEHKRINSFVQTV